MDTRVCERTIQSWQFPASDANRISNLDSLQLRFEAFRTPCQRGSGLRPALDERVQREIQPLCERHEELSEQSVQKIGALREAVEAALTTRLELSEKGPQKGQKAFLPREVLLLC